MARFKTPKVRFVLGAIALTLIVISPAYPVTRMLVQTLSNLVTCDEPIISRLWKTYLALPEEQLILL